MQKISDSTTSANANGEFTEGNPGAGIQATLLKAAWLNAIQRELVNVITAAGISLDAGDDSQVLKAIRAILATASNWAALQGKPTTLLGFGITDAYTKDQIDSAKAPLASPALTGVPTAPTADAATNSTQLATTAFVKAAVNAIVDAAPGALNTLKELADALGGDPNFATSITNLLANKADKATTLGGYGITDAAKASDLPLSGGIAGGQSNLKASASGANAQLSISFDELAVATLAGNYKTLRGGALTVNAATLGAGGLDTGSIAASTWYSVWVIWNGNTVAGLLSLSATSPAMPSGYTHKARVGWTKTDATANRYPLGMTQAGNTVRYKVLPGTNVIVTPVMASGVAGSATGGTYVAVSTSPFVPPTAQIIFVSLVSGGGSAAAAQSQSFGPTNTSANPPPINSSSSGNNASMGSLLLESSNIYWASDAGGGRLLCVGWEDNL